MISKALRILSYPILAAGLSLLLLSGPLSFFLVIHYDSKLHQIFRNMGFIVETRVALVTTGLIIFLALLGFSIWFPIWRLLRTENQPKSDVNPSYFETKARDLYRFWALSLAGLAMVGDLLALGLLLLFSMVALFLNDYPDLPRSLLFLMFYMITAGVILGHMYIVFKIWRSHWRLFRGEIARPSLS